MKRLTDLQLRIIQETARQGHSYPEQTLLLVEAILDLRRELGEVKSDYARLMKTVEVIQK